MKMNSNIKNSIALCTVALLILSCEPEEVVSEVTVNLVEGEQLLISDLPYQKDGFVAASILSTPTSFSYFTNYSQERPTGALDLTTGNAASFSNYFPQTFYKFLAFGASLDSDNLELDRYAVDPETNQIVSAGSLALEASLSQVLIINDNLGVYTIFDTPSLFLFNPTSMEFIQEIPMPNAVQVEALPDQTNSYFHIIHRIQDDRVFLPLTTNSGVSPQFYDANDIYVEVVNLNTMSWEKTMVFEEATYPLTRGMENPMVDEEGNIFILTQGQYSLDFQFGPTAPARSRPQILKIPANSIDFDPDYSFNPVNFIGFQNSVAQLCTGAIYGGNGIAYAVMTAEADVPRVNELLGLLASGMITDEQFNELANLVTNSPNMRWTRIDLNAQTAEVIPGIPFTAGFSYPLSYQVDGKLLFQTFNPTEGVNGYYEYDPETNTATNIYTVSNGGIATHLFVLQE
ncbi:MAG: hypothetical protein AAF575_01875 [Bacteroidota bacterium]|nr:hypothetical protein [uncultured Allomuricauda sp.]